MVISSNDESREMTEIILSHIRWTGNYFIEQMRGVVGRGRIVLSCEQKFAEFFSEILFLL